MVAMPNEHTLKLTVDTSEVVAAMKEYKRQVESTPAPMDAGFPKRIHVTHARKPEESRVVVDGLDISKWITAQQLTLETNAQGIPTLTVNLTASTITVEMLP